MKRFCFVLALTALVGTAHAQYVNLSNSTVFVRTGFIDSWVNAMPGLDDKAWQVIQPTRETKSLEMRSLNIPDIPQGGGFSFMKQRPVDYTVIIPFQANLTLLNASDPALFLMHVGQAWAVYLNGSLLRDEFIHKNGRSDYIERSLRRIIIPIDKRYLERGQNILAFHLRGDPVDDRTGFNKPGPYIIDSYRKLSAENNQYIDLMFIGIYVFFALYHGVLFVLRPQNKGYLFFGEITLLMSLYLFSFTTQASNIIRDTSILRYIEYYALFFIPTTFIAVLGKILNHTTNAFVFTMSGICAAIAVAGIFVRLEPLLYIWYGSATISIIYCLFVVVGTGFRKTYKSIRRKKTPEQIPTHKAFLQVFLTTDAGLVLLAVIALSAASFLDMWRIAVLRLSPFGMRFGFFAFLLIISSVLAKQFTDVAAKTAAMNINLEAEVGARTAKLAEAAAEQTRLNDEIVAASKSLTTIMKEQERDVRVAAAVQKGFFPTKIPKTSEWDIAYVFEPSAGVSGDFYDFYEHKNVLSGFTLGTVSGQGIASSLVTVLVKNILSRYLQDMHTKPLLPSFAAINKALVRELSAVGNTVGCSVVRLGKQKIDYVAMGYTDAMLRKNGKNNVTIVRSHEMGFMSTPLGSDDFKPDAFSFAVNKGDVVILYSTGLVESIDSVDIPFGLGRLAEAFSKADTESSESVLTSIMIDFKNTVSDVSKRDDITAIVLKKL